MRYPLGAFVEEVIEEAEIAVGLQTPESLQRRKLIAEERRRLDQARQVFELIKERQRLTKEVIEFLKKHPEVAEELKRALLWH